MKALLLLLFLVSTSQGVLAAGWIQRADLGGLGRHRAVALAIANKAYMGTGHYNGTGVETYFKDWWEYDPGTNSWSQKANYPGNNGNGELGAHSLSLESVGFVGLGELDKHSLYKYDPATNTWTEVAGPATNTNFQDTGDFTIGHRGYFMNLYNGAIHRYDADLNQWTVLGPVPFTPTYSYSGFSINGKGYMKTTTKLWEYDPATDVWTEKNTFPGFAKQSSMSFVHHGKAYIVCGYGPTHGELTSEVWQYDPLTNGWLQMEDFPGTSRRYSCGFSLGNRAYVGLGTNGTNFKDFWEYDVFAGTDENQSIHDFSIGPNPAESVVNIRSSKTQNFDLILFDSMGRSIRELKTNNGQLTIERGNLKAGVYVYQIRVDGKVSQHGNLMFN